MREKTTYSLGDEEKMIAAAQRDSQAYEQVYNLFYEQVFRFVFRRIDNDAVTADITSQVFLKGMLGIENFRFRGVSYLAWLYRTASNEINGYYRGQKHNRIVSIDESEIEVLFPEEEHDHLEAKKALIISFLERLSFEEITILELKYFEDSSFKEISFVLNKKESMVKMKLYRALDKLKKMFEKEGIVI